MEEPARQHASERLSVTRADVVLVAALLLALVLQTVLTPPDGWRGVVILAPAVAATLALAWRRQRPVPALVATGVALGVAILLDADGLANVGIALVGVYSAIVWGARAAGIVAAALECAMLVARGLLSSEVDLVTLVAISLGIYGITVAAAIAAAARRAVLGAARERAERAEATREIEAARRVTEERLRIARELHDVIGHTLAVIGVQAGVADRLLTARPDAARGALVHVQDAAEAAMGELSSLVRVLRDRDDDAPAGPIRHARDLEELAAQVRAAGTDVTLTTTGDLAPLPPVIGLAVYRIVQESLTNAGKHGTGAAHVSVIVRPDLVTVTTTNPTALDPPAAHRSGGYGLVGLRERAAALDGSLGVTQRNGLFELTATIPVPALPPAGPTTEES